MNTVRNATIEDLNDLVTLGEQSFEFGGLDEFYPYNHKIAAEQFKALIESPQGFLVVLSTDDGVKGMFAAHSFRGICGTPTVTFEQYLYIDEKYRSGSTLRKFMRAYHTWGNDIGAVTQFMVSHEEHDKFEKFYSLYGYRPSERTYIRKVK